MRLRMCKIIKKLKKTFTLDPVQILCKGNIHSGEVTWSKVFLTPSQKRANSSLLEQIPYQKGFSLEEDKQEITKVVSLVKMVENLPNPNQFP